MGMLILLSVIHTVKIRKFRANYGLVALIVLGLAILLGVIDAAFVFETLRGDIYIQPWKILVIFFSSAYVALSLDSNGVLEYIAFKISRKAKTNKQLFLYSYLLAGLLTVFTSYDIVILMLTPIIIYLGRYARAHVIPLLVAEFIAANTFSMILYTGDPTNIIVASSMKFTYLGFSKFMILPTLLSAITGYVLLRVIFRKQIRGKLRQSIQHKKIVKSPLAATLSSIVMIGMLTSLVMSEYIGIPIWMITSGFMLIALVKDMLLELILPMQRGHLLQSIRRLPWNALPFIVFFFVYVHALSNTVQFANTVNILSEISKPGIIISLIGAMSSLLANIINNHPASILMSTLVTRTPIADSPALAPSALAIVIATSIGATITLLGTLAGVMWQTILKDHGITLKHRDYMMVSIRVVPLTLAAGLVGLYISLALF